MSPTEIMISESQERMLLVLSPGAAEPILAILRKYDVPYSAIGRVTADGNLTLKWKGKVVARLPAVLVVNAPLIPWPSKKPSAREPMEGRPLPTPGLGRTIISLLGSPNIASKRWVYRQYDHEVGVRTVLRPGQADAALLRLPNGSLLAVKGDGNSAHSSLDPYNGAAGCVAEACRNVVSVGAEPIALVDHLQFGDPSDPEVYWSFGESIRGMADYCTAVGLPVVGGKVSFYNEDSDTKLAIKPSPIALVVGLVRDEKDLVSMGFEREGDSVLVVGETRPELGGSEYHRLLGSPGRGAVPKPSPSADGALYKAVVDLIRSGAASSVHDCSRGGLAVALAEMSVAGGRGARVDLGKVPASDCRASDILFSESHGRFVMATGDPRAASRLLSARGIAHARVGDVEGGKLRFGLGSKPMTALDVTALKQSYEGSIGRLMD
jgi:phosphoribosylformylglycinamidine synthase